MLQTFDRVRPGVWCSVAAVETNEALTNRLRDFGLVPGTKVRPQYRSPRGDVTAIELRGSVLALRTRDLRQIQVLV